ncbi:MAG: aminoacyl-tRNA hydrolase [Gemmatimonadetes bacterium]|nr:MAG: aminoacyl-tRNA hydrolase [Gemmatimonadota bacterium]PYP53419.1 MAG: aminoacyl-tRNA hydrolase [Gemmatimonadota bacterium]
MKVIVGLGNPGREYAATRHNVGWWLIDHLADVWHFDAWKKNGESHVANGTVGGVKVRLVKPQTYMNLSGQALKNYVRRPFWSPAKDLLVVVDEVQLPVGRTRIRARGTAGGHNGLKSVEQALGTQEYARLRIGVGPSEERKGIYTDLAQFVLSPFARDEREDILALMPQLTATVETWLGDGVEKAMNLHNRPAPEDDKSN